MIHRFFSPSLPLPQSSCGSLTAGELSVHLGVEEARHARRVLRLTVGDAVALFDGRGGTAKGVIAGFDVGMAVRIQGVDQQPPPRPRLDLAVCLPKGSRTDDMVSQLSQLGADTLIPLRTQRSVVDARPAKLERLGRAAIESAKQCGRAWVMTVAGAVDFADVLRGDQDLKLIADVTEAQNRDLATRLADAKHVLVLIGPEGGWTDEERIAAHAAGCRPWRLGPHVMRIETAAAATAAIVRQAASFMQEPAR